MVSQTQKKMGRPKKGPAEKPEQFSIRLTPVHKVLLEMIARDGQMSLSQAVESLVVEKSKSHQIGGQTLMDALYEGMSDFVGAVSQIEERFATPVPDMQTIAKQTALLNSKFAAIFLMPHTLLTTAEQCLSQACIEKGMLPADDVLGMLLADSNSMAALGVDPKEINAYLTGRLAALSA